MMAITLGWVVHLGAAGRSEEVGAFCPQPLGAGTE